MPRHANVRNLLRALQHQAGQALVEYALLLCIGILGFTAGMEMVAIGVNNASANVAAQVSALLGSSSGNNGSSSGNNGNHYGAANGNGTGNSGNNNGNGADNGKGTGNGNNGKGKG